MDTAAIGNSWIEQLDRRLSSDGVFSFSAAWFAMLAGSLLNMLNHNDYPIAVSENSIIAICLAIATGILGLIHSRASFVRPLFDTLLVVLAVDFNVSGSLAAYAAIILTAGTLTFSTLRRRSVAPLVLVIFIVVITSQLLTSVLAGTTREPVRRDIAANGSPLPAIVHVVLDEHIGIEGLNMDDPALHDARIRLQTSYLDKGFSVYGGAYSRHFRTINSMPEIFNFGLTQLGGEPRIWKDTQVVPNAYFDALAAQGYQINVIQTDFVTYCDHDAVKSCWTYRRNDLHPLAGSPLNPLDRARILSAAFLSVSTLTARTIREYDKHVPQFRSSGLNLPFIRPDMLSLTSTLAALDAADVMSESLRQAQPGQVYFAHLLAPHYPHVTRSDCSIRPLSEWTYRRFGSTFGERNRGYADQLICMSRKIENMLEALSHSAAADNAVVIVHGDHGSRITEVDPNSRTIDNLSDSELIAGYATLFAVRLKIPQPHYVDTNIPLSALLKSLTDNVFFALPSMTAVTPDEAEIFIEDREWRPVKTHRMPHFRGGKSLP